MVLSNSIPDPLIVIPNLHKILEVVGANPLSNSWGRRWGESPDDELPDLDDLVLVAFDLAALGAMIGLISTPAIPCTFVAQMATARQDHGLTQVDNVSARVDSVNA